jgi:hypothetical protein
MEEQQPTGTAAPGSEQQYQKKLQEVKNILARYTTEQDKTSFFERNKSAIEGLARGSAVSDIMRGFRKATKPDETYDARVELLYHKNAAGELKFSPRLHFKKPALIISTTLRLPTAAREEYSFSLIQRKLEATVSVGGENVKVALSEADFVELNANRELSRTLKGEGSSDGNNRYEYKVTAYKSNASGRMDTLAITQKETVRLSDEDVRMLQQTGHMDKTIKVGEGVNERKYFVAVDSALNKLAFVPSMAFNFLDVVKVVSLTPPEKLELLEGRQVATKLMVETGQLKGINAGTEVKVRLDPVKKNLKIEMAEAPRQAQKVAQKATMSSSLKAAQAQAQAVAEKIPPAKRQKMGV